MLSAFWGECSECAGTGALHDKMETYIMIDHLQYKQGTSTDRSNLETVFQMVADFLAPKKPVLKDCRSMTSLPNSRQVTFRMSRLHCNLE